MLDIVGAGKMAESAVEVTKLIYPDLAQPGVKKVGEALATVFDLCNTILLPVKLLNSNANVFFNHHMEKYRVNMANIPQDEIAKVHPSIGLKILDELFTVTNEDIADLFINLLTNASTVDGAKYAHPSFIEVIKNLSEDEAKIINGVYNQGNRVKYNYLTKIAEGGSVPLTDKINDVSKLTSLTFNENSLFYMENLIKLGIVEDTHVFFMADIKDYETLELQLQDEKEKYNGQLKVLQEKGEQMGAVINVHKGHYKLTSYGKSFMASVNRKES